MNNVASFFFALLFLAIVLPGGMYEMQRWRESYAHCNRAIVEARRVLSNPICTDPEQHQYHGKYSREMCERAYRETLATPTHCAWKRFWITSEAHTLYVTVARSNWMLLSITVPAILLTIYMHFSNRAARQQLEHHSRERQQFVETVMQRLPPPSRSHSGGYYVEEPYDDEEEEDEFVRLAVRRSNLH